MSAKTGETWINSREKRLLELGVVYGSAIVIEPLFLAARAVVARTEGRDNVITEVERSLVPEEVFIMEKLGNPENGGRVSKILLKMMLDELPQVSAIRQGSMTLFGPRPDNSAHRRRLFDSLQDSNLREAWREVLVKQKTGIISGYSLHSHRDNLLGLPENVRVVEDEIEPNAILRATLDIADFHEASRRHDLALLGGAVSMAVNNGSRLIKAR